MTSTQPPRFWTEPFRVRHSEANRHSVMKLETFFDYLQETAGVHADKLGVGIEYLLQHQQTWVLSKLALQINRHPTHGEEIIVKSWPSGFHKLFAVRQFDISTRDGDPIAQASSFWILLDLARLRPLRLPDALTVPLPDNHDLPTFLPPPDKMPRTEAVDPLTTLVTEHMIDINQHLNNARYVAMANDWIARHTGANPNFSRFDVNFCSATPVHATLQTAGHIDGNEFSLEITGGLDPDDRTLRFQACGQLAQ
ncbi:MAG TPA: thioesterase [Lentisphaeria bacterium]|nr:thioesterase [Lentisphaeria bacterium]